MPDRDVAKDLNEMRRKIALLEGGGRSSRCQERLSCSQSKIKIPRGALIEVSGTARTAFVLDFLKEHSSFKVLWLETDFKLFPPSLEQGGLDLRRFVVVETKKEVFSILRKALRSQVFECVVTAAHFDEERIYKSLRLLTEKSGASTFFLSQESRSFWPIALSIETSWDGHQVKASVLRDKVFRAEAL